MKTIKFWKDNRIDGEHDRTLESIISDFVASEHHANYLAGSMFERAMLNHMMDYGSFDQITDDEWNELHRVYKLQAP